MHTESSGQPHNTSCQTRTVRYVTTAGGSWVERAVTGRRGTSPPRERPADPPRPFRSLQERGAHMRAVTWHGRDDVRVDTVPDPSIQDPTDVIVEITSSGICGSDLHLIEVMAPFMTVGD